MMSFRGQASSAQMTPLGGKLTALACHPTKKVNKAEELTYLSANIAPGLARKYYTGLERLFRNKHFFRWNVSDEDVKFYCIRHLFFYQLFFFKIPVFFFSLESSVCLFLFSMSIKGVVFCLSQSKTSYINRILGAYSQLGNCDIDFFNFCHRQV
jgi:hypothetical protein